MENRFVMVRGDPNDPDVVWDVVVSSDELATGTVKSVVLAARRHCGNHVADCPSCDGSGYRFEEFAINVGIQKGMQQGQVLRIRGLGNATTTAQGEKQQGDVLLTLCVRPKPSIWPHVWLSCFLALLFAATLLRECSS